MEQCTAGEIIMSKKKKPKGCFLQSVKYMLILFCVILYFIFDEKVFNPEWPNEYRIQLVLIFIGIAGFYQIFKWIVNSLDG